MEKEVMAAPRTNNIGRFIRDNNSALILAVLLLVCFMFVDGYANGFYNVPVYASVYGACCIGLGFVMIAGNIDLSVGFQAALAAVTMVTSFNIVYRSGAGAMAAFIVSMLVAVLTGLVCGIFNGFIVAKIGVSPLITTIATNYIFRGFVFNYARSSYTPDDATYIKAIVKTRIGDIKWLTPSVIIIVLLLLCAGFILYKTKLGNSFYIVGDNPEAAAYSGISVQKTVLASYILCGLLAGITGIMMVSSDGYAIYTQGTSLSAFPISCCVIGGIKMTGGKGTAVHLLLGILIMRAITTMMNVMFLGTELVNFITGVLLIIVLIIDRFTSSKEAE